ncbi:MAG: hypothetical protein PHN96_05380 [Eubacteriales bacterium]|nr:hypothetical protein [Eubacteriales bacterium]
MFLDLFKKKKEEETASEQEPVFFISSPMVWSAHVESYLEEKGIPYLKQGRRGAALAVELGATQEIYDYYIPSEAVESAMEEIGELKQLVHFE